MCCVNSPSEMKRFLTKHKNHKLVTVYKILDSFNCSPYVRMKFKEGWNISNSRACKPCLSNKDVVLGIHVYLKPALGSWWNNSKCIKCKALIADILAIDGDHAVFKQIYVPRGKLS